MPFLHQFSITYQIAVIFREKATQIEHVVVAGKTAKAPALLGVLGEIDYKFIITIAQDAWLDLDDTQKVALLDHHLCACGVKEHPQNGDPRYYVRPADMSFYREEVERHFGRIRYESDAGVDDYLGMLDRIYTFPWFNADRPDRSEAERRFVWENRVALLDALFYAPDLVDEEEDSDEE